MIRRISLMLLLGALAACTARETPQQKQDHQALKREIERPLNRAHEAEAAAKAQAAQNEQALKDATGE